MFWDVVLFLAHSVVMDGLTAVRTLRHEEGQGLLKRSLVIALSESPTRSNSPLTLSAGNAGQNQIDQALQEGMDAGRLRCGFVLALLIIGSGH